MVIASIFANLCLTFLQKYVTHCEGRFRQDGNRQKKLVGVSEVSGKQKNGRYTTSIV